MSFILWLSDSLIPFAILFIVGFGVLMRRPVYDDFAEGAKEGAKTVFGVLPALVGLMTGEGVLRASGFLDAVSGVLGRWTQMAGLPPQLLPVAIAKLFSSGAATGLALDIFQTSGPDSPLGLAVSLMLSSTESVFYTMSIYFLSVKVKKTRYTLPGALLATLAGIAASVFLAGQI